MQTRQPAGAPASKGGQYGPGIPAPEFAGQLNIINRDIDGCDLGDGITGPHLIVGDEDPYCARCDQDFPELSTLNATGPAATSDRFGDRARHLLAENPGKEAVTPDEVRLGDTVATDLRSGSHLRPIGVVARVDKVSDLSRYEIIFHDGRSLAYTANSPVFIDRHIGYQYKTTDRWDDRARALTSNTTPADVLEDALSYESTPEAFAIIAGHQNATSDQIRRAAQILDPKAMHAAAGNPNTDTGTLRWIHNAATQAANTLHRNADTQSKYRDRMPIERAAKENDHLARRAADALTARDQTV